MKKVSRALIALAFGSAMVCFAQSAPSPPVQVTGVIQSFSGNMLDVKPATAPAIWVTLPTDLPVDRNALKPNVAVSVEGYWAVVCYVATRVTVAK